MLIKHVRARFEELAYGNEVVEFCQEECRACCMFYTYPYLLRDFTMQLELITAHERSEVLRMSALATSILIVKSYVLNRNKQITLIFSDHSFDSYIH